MCICWFMTVGLGFETLSIKNVGNSLLLLLVELNYLVFLKGMIFTLLFSRFGIGNTLLNDMSLYKAGTQNVVVRPPLNKTRSRIRAFLFYTEEDSSSLFFTRFWKPLIRLCVCIWSPSYGLRLPEDFILRLTDPALSPYHVITADVRTSTAIVVFVSQGRSTGSNASPSFVPPRRWSSFLSSPPDRNYFLAFYL